MIGTLTLIENYWTFDSGNTFLLTLMNEFCLEHGQPEDFFHTLGLYMILYDSILIIIIKFFNYL